MSRASLAGTAGRRLPKVAATLGWLGPSRAASWMDKARWYMAYRPHRAPLALPSPRPSCSKPQPRRDDSHPLRPRQCSVLASRIDGPPSSHLVVEPPCTCMPNDPDMSPLEAAHRPMLGTVRFFVEYQDSFQQRPGRRHLALAAETLSPMGSLDELACGSSVVVASQV